MAPRMPLNWELIRLSFIAGLIVGITVCWRWQTQHSSSSAVESSLTNSFDIGSATFQQESQRFVKYDDADWIRLLLCPRGEYGPDIESHLGHSLTVYRNLREKGVPAQIARYVLPNAMGTRLIMKANLREWRHVVNLRTAKAAQPEMQDLAWQIYDQLVEAFPNIMYKATEAEEVR